jgi:hypothetical protein
MVILWRFLSTAASCHLILARDPYLGDEVEFQAGSSFESLPHGSYYKACMWWNGLNQAGTDDRMDLLCCGAVLLILDAGSQGVSHQ